jgi:PKD repeat protein
VGTPIGLNAFKAMYPTAKITKPASIVHGISAAFSGTTSTDPFPGGSIVAYSWTFGDGGTSSLASPSHTYAAAGTYSVHLVIRDVYGVYGQLTVSVSVS